MTPNNIVNMAKLKGLDAIAISDHNSCKNCAAAIEAGNRVGVTVLPAMELTTEEDIHVLCLFDSLQNALSFNERVDEGRIKIQNREDIYGQQLIMDSEDRVTGKIDELLTIATDIGIFDVFKIVNDYGGVAVSAHIDREANSSLYTLGDVPCELGFSFCELSNKCEKNSFFEKNEYLKERYKYITDSDAHYLWDISENDNRITVSSLKPEAILNYFREK